MTKRKNAERRLSFALRPEHCASLVAQLGQAGAHWTAETKILSLYLDTPDGVMGKLGFGFGVRRRGDTTLNDSREALRRFARNLPMQNGWTTFRHALSVAAPTDARKIQNVLRSSEVRRRLTVVFQSEAKRSFWSWPIVGENADITLEQARMVNGATAELALVTLVYPSGLSSPIHAFLAAISAKVPLRMTGETLALGAYRLAGHREIALPSFFLPRLHPDMAAGEAFQAIARAALDQFLLAKLRVQLWRDSEGVHQSRVALRRLSAAISLFSSLVSGDDLRNLKQGLRRSKEALRAARDLDVRLHDLAALASKNPELPSQSVRKLLAARRKKAYDLAVAALDSPQEEVLLRRLVEWIDTGDWTRDTKRSTKRAEPLSAFVQRTFGKLTRKLYRRCGELEDVSDEDRHRTRIKVKNLRYGAEFLDDLVNRASRNGSRKRHHAFVSALKHLQTFLGEENDARTAHDYFAGLTSDKDSSSANAEAVHAGTAIASYIKPSDPKTFHKMAAKLRRQLSDAKPTWEDLVRN
jgi:CHAD domain-containing protein